MKQRSSVKFKNFTKKSQFKIDAKRAKSKDDVDDKMLVFDSPIDMEAYLFQHSHYLSSEKSQLHSCSLE